MTGGPLGDGDHVLELRGGAPAQPRGQRVAGQVDRHRGALVGFDLVGQAQHRVAGPRVVGAGLQDQRRHAQVDALQAVGHLVGRHARLADPQQHGAGAVAQRVEHRGVDVLGRDAGHRGGRERLGDLPAGPDVAQRVAAAHERPLAWQRRFGQLVERGVERADRDPVVRRGFQQPLRRVPQLLGVLPGAFGQHSGNRTAPTPANLFQVGEFGYINGHRLLPFPSIWATALGIPLDYRG